MAISEAVEEPDIRPYWRTGAVTLGAVLSVSIQSLDSHTASVALPTIRGAMSASKDEIAWVLTGFLVCIAISTPPIAWLSRRYGRRKVFLSLIAGFSVSSIFVGYSTSLTEMVCFRVVEGLFAGGLAPLCQQVLLDTYPRRLHGFAMGCFSIGILFGVIAGPTMGGFIVEYYDWRWVFLMNVPISIIAFALIWFFVPETEKQLDRPFDFVGFTALSIAIGGLQLMLNRGERLDWFDSTEIILEAGFALGAMWVFFVHITTAKHPFVKPSLFNNRNYSVGLFLTFGFGVMIYGHVGFVPTMLQKHMEIPALTTGLLMVPRGVASMVGSILAGVMLTRLQPRTILIVACALLSLFTWRMTLFTPDTSTAQIMNIIGWQGFTMGLVSVCVSTATFTTLTQDQRAEGTSFFNLVRKLGSSVGVSFLVGQLVRNSQAYRSSIAENVTPYNKRFDLAPKPESWQFSNPDGIAAMEREVLRQAEFLAYLQDFWWLTFVTLAMIPLALLLRTTNAQIAR